MVERCGDMELSLYEREGGYLMEGVENFKYLGRPLDQMDDDWKMVQWNFKRAQRVWGRLGKMLQSKGVE